MRKSESQGQSQGQDQIIMTHLTWTLKKLEWNLLKKQFWTVSLKLS